MHRVRARIQRGLGRQGDAPDGAPIAPDHLLHSSERALVVHASVQEAAVARLRLGGAVHGPRTTSGSSPSTVDRDRIEVDEARGVAAPASSVTRLYTSKLARASTGSPSTTWTWRSAPSCRTSISASTTCSSEIGRIRNASPGAAQHDLEVAPSPGITGTSKTGGGRPGTPDHRRRATDS